MKIREILRNFWAPGSNIADRAVISGIWATAINVLDRALQLGSILIIARVIGPEEFGLFGIGLLVLTALRGLSQLGTSAALIQRVEDNVDHLLDSAWTLEVSRGIILAFIAIVTAPLIGTILNEPRAVPLIQAMGILPILQGLRNPATVYFQKDLSFHKEFIFRISGSIANFSVSVPVAIIYQSVWALIAGLIASAATRLVASYVLDWYKPNIRFNQREFLELMDYGKWIFGSGSLLFFIKNADDAVLVGLLGPTSLGIYQMSYRISNAPATEVSQVFNKVLFPTYSKIQEDEVQLREGFYKGIKLVALGVFPISGGVAVIAPVFVPVTMGAQWSDSIFLIQILALFGLLRGLGAADGPLVRSIGRPDVATKFHFLQFIILAILMYPLTAQFGAVGTATAVVLSILPINIGKSIMVLRLVGGKISIYLSILVVPAIVTIAMIMIVYTIILIFTPIIALLLGIPIGIVSYILGILIIDNIIDYGIWPLMSRMKQTFANKSNE